MEELRNGRAVARLRSPLPGLFGAVLDRLGQHGGIGQRGHAGPCTRQCGEDRLDRAFGIDRHLFARQRLKLGNERLTRADRHGIAQVCAQRGRDLALSDEQFSGAIGVGQHKTERNRRAVDIGPADVEQPGHAVERRDHRGIEPLGGQPFGHPAALGLARLAGQVAAVDQRRGGRRCGLIGPDRVDRIAAHRHQLCPFGVQRCGGRINPGLAVEPRIEPDLRACRGIFSEPGGNRSGRDRLVIKQPSINLIAHLDGIAAIDENRRFAAQHRRRSGRSAEPGQPVQPLGIAADIFAHMLVGDRHHEPVQGAGGKLAAQRGKARLVGGGGGTRRRESISHAANIRQRFRFGE